MFKKSLFLLFFISFLAFLQGESTSRNLANERDNFIEEWKRQSQEKQARNEADKKTPSRDLNENVMNSERFLLTQSQINQLILNAGRANNYTFYNRNKTRDYSRGMSTIKSKSDEDRNLANERDNFIEEWKRQREERQQTRENTDKKTPPRDLDEERSLLTKDQIAELIMKNARYNYNISKNRSRDRYMSTIESKIDENRNLANNEMNQERFLLTKEQIDELIMKNARLRFNISRNSSSRGRGVSTIESKIDENRNLANERDNFIEEWKRQRQEKHQTRENTDKKTPPRDLDESLRKLGIEDKILSRFAKNKKIIEDEEKEKEKPKRKENNEKEH